MTALVRRRAVWPALFVLSLAFGYARPGSAQPPVEVPPDHVVVRGQIFYTDRLGERSHPAAGLRVEVWDLDAGFPNTAEKLATTTTGPDGRFESRAVPNVDGDGAAGRRDATQDIFIKLFTDNGTVRLLEPVTEREYAWNSYEIDPRDGIARNVPNGVFALSPFYLLQDTKDVEALWLFVNLADVWYYLQGQTGEDPGALLAYWSRTSRDGPHYDTTLRELRFRGEDAGYGQLVGQYAAYALLHNIYGEFPDPWLACLARTPAPDLRLETDAACALLQGFATFLPLAVYADPEWSAPGVPALDLDRADATTRGWDSGDRVPARIAGAFWDLHEGDTTDDGADRFNATFGDIWDVLEGERPTTMPEWWAGWQARGKDGCGAVGSLFQNTIEYNTPPEVAAIPDIVIDEDDTATLDLTSYLTDRECSDAAFEVTLADAGAPEAGVSLLPGNIIQVAPQPDWFGETEVTLRVSDGLVTTELQFRVIVRPLNDCPVIAPRVPDPEPAGYGQPITLDLAPYGKDPEDAPDALAWDVHIDPLFANDISVVGRGTTQITFLPDRKIRENYGVRVTLFVRDREGCEASQTLALYWAISPNGRPIVDAEHFVREYVAPVNTTISVDLRGIATDAEDDPTQLEWFVVNLTALDAQVHRVGPQQLDFEPEVGFVGTNVAELEVQDSGGARATAAISLTWRTTAGGVNLPPRILRDKLVGKTAGRAAAACYDLTDKAVDPDDSPYALRWYALEYDDTQLFVGAQGTRELCLRSRPNFVGCLDARFLVRDPAGGEDSHEVRTCWRTIYNYLPIVTRH